MLMLRSELQWLKQCDSSIKYGKLPDQLVLAVWGYLPAENHSYPDQ